MDPMSSTNAQSLNNKIEYFLQISNCIISMINGLCSIA
jgi:hypothetical protein